MASKEEVLQYIREVAKSGLIKREEIIRVFDEGSRAESTSSSKLGIAEILYYIGGAIVFFGIAILVNQNWNSLDSFTRVLVTLGSSIAAYFAALLFGLRKKTENVGIAFHLISALLMPMGLFITFREAGLSTSGSGMQSLISLILVVVYVLSLAVFKKTIFTFFSIIFGTWLFFSYTNYLIIGSNSLASSDFFLYRVLVAGLAYLFLGYYFSENKKRSLSGFLYGFGILGFLGAALALGGWKPHQKIIWELAFPALVFGTLFLSVYLKSGSFLTFGTIYLMGYIMKITAEYFSRSLGWPLSLVVIGLLLIASGYLFIHLKRKYLS